MEENSITPSKDSRIFVTTEVPEPRNRIERSEKYGLTFYYKIFAKALAIHSLIELFGPFGMLLSRLIFGSIINDNMMLKLKFQQISLTTVGWLITISGPIIILIYPEKDEALLGFTIGLSTIQVIKVLLLSLKYGYYTQRNIYELETTPLPLEKLRYGYILQAWAQIPDEVANSELDLSLARHSLKQDSLIFAFSAEKNQALLKEDTEFNLKEMANLCLDYANKPSTSKKVVVNLCKLITIGYGLTPIVVRLVRGKDPIALDPVEIVYMISSSFLAAYIAGKLLSFLATGILDFYRKNKFMSYCYALLTGNKKKEIFHMDISVAKNFLAWYYLRTLMLDFGKRYTDRMSLYMSVVLIFSFSVVVLMIIQSFGVIGSTYNFYFASLIYLAILSIFVLLIVVLFAVNVNNSLRIHIDVLLELSSQNRRSGHPDDELNDTISFVINKLDSDSVLRPIKVLWLEANNGLLIQFAATFLSGALAVIQVYYAY